MSWEKRLPLKSAILEFDLLNGSTDRQTERIKSHKSAHFFFFIIKKKHLNSYYT